MVVIVVVVVAVVVGPGGSVAHFREHFDDANNQRFGAVDHDHDHDHRPAGMAPQSRRPLRGRRGGWVGAEVGADLM